MTTALAVLIAVSITGFLYALSSIIELFERDDEK